MIKGVRHVNSMEDVFMKCANICGIQFAITDVSGGKPLLYKFAWKVIRFIENKKTIALRICQWYSWQKFTSFSNFSHRFCKT
jgi:hypothetical protein